MVKSLEKCYDFAMNFNKMVYLRYCLWKNGFLQEMKELPGLIKQEKETLFCLVRLEILAYQGRNCEDRLRCQRFLDDFIMYDSPSFSLIINWASSIARLSQWSTSSTPFPKTL